MQAAVPFTWEERPGKPKQRPRKYSKVSDLQACASTGDYDLRNPEKIFSLQELFSKDSIRSSGTTNKEGGFCLTPPPRLRYASGMGSSSSSSSSSSSQSRSFATPTCSPEADDDEDCSKKCKQEAGRHARTRSVTLLDLIKTGNRDEIEACHSGDHRAQGEKTLGELFKSDTPKGLPVRHRAGSDNSFMGGARRRRSSYLPYKQGLLSIFCVSPYKNGLLRCPSPAGNHSRKYR